MILVGAIVLGLLSQPATFPQTPENQRVGAPGELVFAPGLVPTAGTEAALRRLVAGLASGSPDYDKLSPQFAEVVRRDLPMTHRLFASLGDLKSVTFRGRGPRGDDVYNGVRQGRGHNVGRSRRRRQDGRGHPPTCAAGGALTAGRTFLPRKRSVRLPSFRTRS